MTVDTRALADTYSTTLWSQYGEVLRLVDSSTISMNYLTEVLKRPNYQARYRLFVLNSDETIDYEIPQEDIIINSGNFTENLVLTLFLPRFFCFLQSRSRHF